MSTWLQEVEEFSGRIFPTVMWSETKSLGKISTSGSQVGNILLG